MCFESHNCSYAFLVAEAPLRTQAKTVSNAAACCCIGGLGWVAGMHVFAIMKAQLRAKQEAAIQSFWSAWHRV